MLHVEFFILSLDRFSRTGFQPVTTKQTGWKPVLLISYENIINRRRTQNATIAPTRT